MRHEDEVKEKMVADRHYLNQAGTAGATVRGQTSGLTGEYRPSPAEQAELDTQYHSNKAQKSAQAAAFFSAHPEFDEFIRLIRSGVISI